MILYAKTRAAARTIVSRRLAAGWPAKLVDNGKGSVKRFAVSLKREA